LPNGETITLFEERHACRLCGSTGLEVVVPLAPLAIMSPNVGNSEAAANVSARADVIQCGACGFLQLPVLINPRFQYANFRYKTSISLGLREHFERLMRGLERDGEIQSGSFVFEVGSNDGTLLEFPKSMGARVLGIDPAVDIAREATSKGIPTIAGFFDQTRGERIRAEHGEADLVISNNTIANLDDLTDIFQGLRQVIAKDGLLVIETQYALDVFEKYLLDVIYHEHVSYFAVKPMARFLERLDFELIGAERIPPKGGSIRFLAQPADGHRPVHGSVDQLIALETRNGLYDGRLFSSFNDHIQTLGDQLRKRMKRVREETGRCYAYGASVGCSALIHYFGLAPLIDAVFDDTPLSAQLMTGDGPLPVRPGAELADETPSEVAVLAWRYIDAIAKGNDAFLKKGGRFYRVLPTLSDYPP